MTLFESFILAFCFGTCLGSFLGNIIQLIIFWGDKKKDKCKSAQD